MEGDSDVLKSFLVESARLLDRADREAARLRSAPGDTAARNGLLRCARSLRDTARFLRLARFGDAAERLDRELARPEPSGDAVGSALRELRALRDAIQAGGAEPAPELGALLEKVSVDLIVRGGLEGCPYAAEVAAAAKACEDARAREPLSRLHALLTGPSTPEAHAEALDLLGRLSSKADAAPAPGEAVLSYDRAVDREILVDFFPESAGHLQAVEENVLRLEAAPSDLSAVHRAFRAVHSLKGLFACLNARAPHDLAHEFEGILDQARQGRRTLDAAACGALLRSVDLLRETLGLIQAHAKTPDAPFPAAPGRLPSLVAEIRALGSAGGTSTPSVPAEEPAETAKAGGLERAGVVRVKVEKLDSLLDAIGELVVTQAQVNEDPELKRIETPRLSRNLAQLCKIARDLQAIAMSLRMYALRDTFARMTRVTRDIARKERKEVDVVLSGEDTEMDKNVLEAIVDPLTHLVRNAVDHGVGTPEERAAEGKPARGRITLSARHQGDTVVVEVADDGRGLNFDRILRKGRELGLLGPDETPPPSRLAALIFAPGFSTAPKVTDVSGRGVGLDVVRRNVEALGGAVTVSSNPGRGSVFTLTLPLTLAIVDGLIVRVGPERYVVPITAVVESFRPTAAQVSTVRERGEMVDVRGQHLPLLRLADYAGVSADTADVCRAIVMIIEGRGERCGLVVDEILGQQQVVIKNLGECLRGIQGVAGGAILGDGRVGLILDVAEALAVSRRGAPVLTADAR